MVRKDLSYGQIVVQSAHACLSAAKFIPSDLEHPHLVVLGVSCEQILYKYAEKLKRLQIDFIVFHEPDKGNEATAIATEPIYSSDKRKVFQSLQLLKM